MLLRDAFTYKTISYIGDRIAGEWSSFSKESFLEAHLPAHFCKAAEGDALPAPPLPIMQIHVV